MVILSNALDGLRSLTPGSVALVLSDLPSGETQAEFDTRPDMASLWGAVWTAATPAAWVVFLCSSLRFAAHVLASQEKHFRHDLIWHKSLATGHLNARRAPLRAHEFVLCFNRQTSATFNPQMLEGASPIHRARRTSHGENYGEITRVTESRAGATDRYPTSVLHFASVGTSSKQRVHPQQKPVPLLRWLIRAYTNPNGLVVDPYAGSGSTGEAARNEGRRFVGFDSCPRFASLVDPTS